VGNINDDDDDELTNRARIVWKLRPYVLEFRAFWGGRMFHAEDLRKFVLQRAPGTAPDSPGRCMRELRQLGEINYECVNRRKSLYLFLPLKLVRAA
jgi:hypothetical protein